MLWASDPLPAVQRVGQLQRIEVRRAEPGVRFPLDFGVQDPTRNALRRLSANALHSPPGRSNSGGALRPDRTTRTIPLLRPRPAPITPLGPATRAARNPRSCPTGHAHAWQKPPLARPASLPACSPCPHRHATRYRPLPSQTPQANPPARPAFAWRVPLLRVCGDAAIRCRSTSPTAPRVTLRPCETERVSRHYRPCDIQTVLSPW